MSSLGPINIKALFVLSFMLAFLPQNDGLIITTVLAGDRKFKTVSFDSWFLKPLTFEKDLPFSTQFRRHKTVRPPKFDIDINIPIKLPMEDDQVYEKPEKPSFSEFFLETKDLTPKYSKPIPAVEPQEPRVYDPPPPKQDISYADSMQNFQVMRPDQPLEGSERNSNPLSNSPKQVQTYGQSSTYHEPMSRSDDKDAPNKSAEQITQQESASYEYKTENGGKDYDDSKYYNQEFVPGGYVNLRLSGPVGGPKMTYRDYDRENWAHQMSQTDKSMPYPILNYHQLQNFYGGLGTFTNGLPNNEVEVTALDKLKSKMVAIGAKLLVKKKIIGKIKLLKKLKE